MKDVRIAVLVLSVALVGCLGRTPPPKLYLLSPLEAPKSEESADAPDFAVGVGPVTVPEYLKRPEIVTRVGCGAGTEDFCGELRLAELDLWAEPLEESLARVISENLSVLLSSERVLRYPWRPSTPLDYRVTVDVIRFDGDDQGRAVLVARWSVVGVEKDEVLLVKRTSHREEAGAGGSEVEGYGARVSALSRALAGLSREIADSLQSR